MGTYTQLALNVSFKRTIPTSLLEQLRAGKVEDIKGRDWCIRSGGGSFCCAAVTGKLIEPDDFNEHYSFYLWTSIKNYDKEWQQLLDILAPYIVSSGYVGWLLHEEADHPTLIYIEDGKAKYRETCYNTQS
jgi:hypothetical protein